jgi:hypothetical protein
MLLRGRVKMRADEVAVRPVRQPGNLNQERRGGGDVEYDQEFERDFMQRTLELVQRYEGPHDATLLLNCLLGLLIVPKEASIERIPLDPLRNLKEWGISPESIKACGAPNKTNPQPQTLRGVVHNLRNAVAHFRFSPRHENRRVVGFSFSDKNGFDASIDLDEMKVFVHRLADHLERTAGQPA